MIRYSVLSTSRTSLRFSISGSDAFSANHPTAYLQRARFHDGYVVMSSDYIVGYGRTPEEAWADAIFVDENDLLTHAVLTEVIQ